MILTTEQQSIIDKLKLLPEDPAYWYETKTPSPTRGHEAAQETPLVVLAKMGFIRIASAHRYDPCYLEGHTPPMMIAQLTVAGWAAAKGEKI